MITSPVIRVFEASDESAVIALLQELQAAEVPMNPHLRPVDEIGRPYLDETRDWCSKNAGVMLVAILHDVIIGYACVLADCTEEGKDSERPYHYAYVADLVITRKERGQGYGKLMLQHCEQLARDRGQTIFRIGVMSENRSALRLYHAFGFRDRHMTLEKRLT